MCIYTVLNVYDKLKINLKDIYALKDTGALEEKVIQIGLNEVIAFYFFVNVCSVYAHS